MCPARKLFSKRRMSLMARRRRGVIRCRKAAILMVQRTGSPRPFPPPYANSLKYRIASRNSPDDKVSHIHPYLRIRQHKSRESITSMHRNSNFQGQHEDRVFAIRTSSRRCQVCHAFCIFGFGAEIRAVTTSVAQMRFSSEPTPRTWTY
jgi:hypothetical protein